MTRRQLRRSMGVCIQCGDDPHTPGGTYCRGCLDRRNELRAPRLNANREREQLMQRVRTRRHRLRLRAEGKCQRCGKSAQASYCHACAIVRSEQRQARKEA